MFIMNVGYEEFSVITNFCHVLIFFHCTLTRISGLRKNTIGILYNSPSLLQTGFGHCFLVAFSQIKRKKGFKKVTSFGRAAFSS